MRSASVSLKYSEGVESEVEMNLWTYKQASEYLGVKQGTLRSWVSRRQIDNVKLGRLVRFRKSDLDRWIEQNYRESESL